MPLQVAEMPKSREIVGVVQGCIKRVGIGNIGSCLKLGCLLGLRVSPRHRFASLHLLFSDISYIPCRDIISRHTTGEWE